MMIQTIQLLKKAAVVLSGVACVLALTVLFVAGSFSTKVLAADAPASAKDDKNPFEGKAEAIAQGNKIFNEKCADCHGDGTGGAGPDLTDDVWIYGGSDAAVFETVSFGRKGGMPQWRTELSRDERWQVISYIRSIHRK